MLWHTQKIVNGCTVHKLMDSLRSALNLDVSYRRPQTPLPNQRLEVFKPSAGGNDNRIGADLGLSVNQAKNGREGRPVPGKAF